MLFVARGLPWADSPVDEAFVFIWNDEAIINAHHSTKATAGIAGPQGRVIRKRALVSRGIIYMTVCTVQGSPIVQVGNLLTLIIEGRHMYLIALMQKSCLDTLGKASLVVPTLPITYLYVINAVLV